MFKYFGGFRKAIQRAYPEVLFTAWQDQEVLNERYGFSGRPLTLYQDNALVQEAP